MHAISKFTITATMKTTVENSERSSTTVDCERLKTVKHVKPASGSEGTDGSDTEHHISLKFINQELRYKMSR